jgi:hypothetical protein
MIFDRYYMFKIWIIKVLIDCGEYFIFDWKDFGLAFIL